jgi:PPOX class probable F420-dependent enzyme
VRLDEEEARRRFFAARVARLATVSAEGEPHLVPVTFAGSGDIGLPDTVVFAVDTKPKASTDLRRLRNIRANPRVSLLVDHYDEDWSRLWWVRADGAARILDPGGGPVGALVGALVAKYPRYGDQPPAGPVVEVTVTRWRGWAYGPAPA